MTAFAPDRISTLTFDCYGTLIDWEAGALGVLQPFLSRHGVALSDDEIVYAFQDMDAASCEPPYRSYRTVLAEVMDGFGRRFGVPLGHSDRDALAVSLPSWRPCADTVEALQALAGRYKLAIISNVDDDLVAASLSRLGIRFDHVITSQQAKCYKPDAGIFEEAARRLDAEPGSVAHVAEGANEILPATRLGWSTIWVRRHGRSARFLKETPDLVVPDLKSLAHRLGAGG